MPTYIPNDFEPRPEDYQASGISQIPREFLDIVVTPEFIEYWEELKEKKLKKGRKDAWYTTWRNRARFLWKIKGPAWEENRHKHKEHRPRFKNDLFEEILADKIAESEQLPKPERRRIVYHKPQNIPPKPGKAMTPEEAFKQLRQEGHIK